MKKRFLIHLTPDERQELTDLLDRKKLAKFKRQRAQILLLADEERTGGALFDREISVACLCSTSTVFRTRQDFCEGGLPAALERAKSPQVYPPKLDGAAEAVLVATCCGPPPEGHAVWTLRMLADKLVELEVVKSVSHETVRRKLNANDLKPWLIKSQWCIPPLGQCGVRVQHGGRARRLPPAV